MNYPQCLEYLDRLGNEVLTMKFGLENIRRLLALLGNPEQQFGSVLIAGTNGKGSVARFLHSTLHHSGICVGLFTSPHLIRIEERIVVSGRCITQESFAEAFSEVVTAVEGLKEEHHPTYFETITAVTLLYFANAGVELAVLEAGLGGRLDSTNAVQSSLLSVVTPVHLDHQQVLGTRLEDIAFEKAGIFRAGTPVLSAGQDPSVRAVLRERSESLGCSYKEVSVESRSDLGGGRYNFKIDDVVYRLSAFGSHQVDNAALAVEAASELANLGYPVNTRGIQTGIESTQPGSSLIKVDHEPCCFLDGGHNLHAAWAVTDFITNHTSPPRSLVVGMMKDKDFRAFLDVLSPAFSHVIFTSISSERAESPENLLRVCPTGEKEPDPREAFRLARESARTVLVTGSIYLVGQLLEALRDDPDWRIRI
jgi:dihydrofolate synthase/folylpolyglutamate synthase